MLYPKITGPFKRHTEGDLRNKLDIGNWSRPEFELLKDLPWEWTEKVDGTNVRIIWDGYRVRIGGRTDDAQMPLFLRDMLDQVFTEELLEQQFGKDPVILFGEGYGARIQKGGGNYRPDPGFVLFDVKVGDWWLLRHSVVDVANSLGLDVVPTVLVNNVAAAISYVKGGFRSLWGDFEAEGLVGKPPMGLTARDGDRLLMKIKTKDLLGIDHGSLV
jgi:RNA ligase